MLGAHQNRTWGVGMKDQNVIGLFIEINPRTSFIIGVRVCTTSDTETRAVIKASSRIMTKAAWLWLRGLFLGDDGMGSYAKGKEPGMVYETSRTMEKQKG
jgi:hypothetical protein